MRVAVRGAVRVASCSSAIGGQHPCKTCLFTNRCVIARTSPPGANLGRSGLCRGPSSSVHRRRRILCASQSPPGQLATTAIWPCFRARLEGCQPPCNHVATSTGIIREEVLQNKARHPLTMSIPLASSLLFQEQLCFPYTFGFAQMLPRTANPDSNRSSCNKCQKPAIVLLVNLKVKEAK